APALSLTAAVLPGARLVYLDPDAIMEGEVLSEKRLAAELGPVPPGVDALVLVDPFSVQPDQLAMALDLVLPHAVKVGALATAGPVPRSTMLYGHTAHRRGALVLLLPHEVRVRPIVAQGCRPVGRAHVITRRDGQAILELDNKPALAAMKDCYAGLSEHDRALFKHSLFVGVEMDRDEVEARPDRLLVRNLLGVDPDREAFGVAAELHDYDVVQFVLRDSLSATEELTSLLMLARDGGATPAGALLFSCVGRGRHLFDEVDHDPRLFGEAFEGTPIGGCFSDGEIAPVGGRTFLHGYTSAFALIERRR
ncbi:MAG: FIST C-terminal domain-containing protein, partial [Polyangia bacterium]